MSVLPHRLQIELTEVPATSPRPTMAPLRAGMGYSDPSPDLRRASPTALARRGPPHRAPSGRAAAVTVHPMRACAATACLNPVERRLNTHLPVHGTMAAKRRQTVTFLEGKKMPRRIRVKFSAPKSTGAKRVSFLEGKKSPRRTRVTFLAKTTTKARGR